MGIKKPVPPAEEAIGVDFCPKKKSLEDNVFETRVATMKFMNAGATGKKGTELEAKIFRTKKVTCLSTFTRDEKTIASERKKTEEEENEGRESERERERERERVESEDL